MGSCGVLNLKGVVVVAATKSPQYIGVVTSVATYLLVKMLANQTLLQLKPQRQ